MFWYTSMKNETLTLTLNSLDDMAKLAQVFVNAIDKGFLTCLYGPIGCGKTTFVKNIGEKLAIEEAITSPSFVIINEYHSGKMPLYHFDLYRLEKEGVKTILSELEEYSSDEEALTFVEWAEFSQGNLLEERLDIIFSYDETFSDRRFVELNAYSAKTAELLDKVRKSYANS